MCFCRMSYSMASHHHFSVDCHLVVILHLFHTYQLVHLSITSWFARQKMPLFSISSSTSLLLFWWSWFSLHVFTMFASSCLVLFVNGFPSLFLYYIYTELIFIQSNARVPSCCRFLVLFVNGFPSLFIYTYTELIFTQSNDRILVSTGYHWIIETSSQHELIMVTVCSSMMEVGRITENPSFPSDSSWSPILVYPQKKRIFFHNFICF